MTDPANAALPGPASLLDAAWWVARGLRDDVDTRPGEACLAAMAAALREALPPGPDAPAVIAALRRVMHVGHGFKGDDGDYGHPDNSFLDRVVERRRGIPITLSILAVEVVRRAGFAAEGIGFPTHFLARVDAGDTSALVDPFGGCLLVTDADLRVLLARVMGPDAVLTPAMTQPASPRSVARRMLNNLKASYLRRDDPVQALRTLDRVLELAPDDREERRDRGLVREVLGQDAGALADFEAYLATNPAGAEADAIRSRIVPLRQRLSRWN
jgi:regulator of sirC expression with transglutaminase-like and TPR domain